jgi:hypothetical protein
MLYLEPPYPVYKGVTFFRDHEDDYHFYYMGQPHISFAEEDGRRVPLFSFLRYAADTPKGPKDGGLFSLQVDTSVPRELLEEAKAHLAATLSERPKEQKALPDLARPDPSTFDLLRDLGLRRPEARPDKPPAKEPPPAAKRLDPKKIELSPVPFHDGAVKLMILGRSGDDKDAPVRINQPAKPSLHGDNAAIFSVSLEPTEASLLLETLKGKHAPIGVVYELYYTGLKPAYRVTVKAEWDQVVTHFKREGGIRVFSDAMIRSEVKDLVDRRVIAVDAITYVTEEESKSAVQQKQKFLEQLTDMITTRFFEPVLGPNEKKKEAAGPDVAGAVKGVLDTLRGLNAMFVFNEERAQASLKMNLTAEATERVAIKASVWPRASLVDLLDVVRRGGGRLEDHVKSVALQDQFFSRRQVKVISRADFQKNSIASISVDLAYEGQAPEGGPVFLSKSDEQGERRWHAALDERQRMKPAVEASYTVNLAEDELLGQRPSRLTRRGLRVDGDILEIFPQNDLFTTRSIPVEAAASFPWDRYPEVEIEIRYQDEKNEITVDRTVVLKKDRPRSQVRLFVMDPTLKAYEVEVRHRGAPGVRDEVIPFRSSDRDAIEVRDPLPETVEVGLYPDDVDWKKVRRLIVEMTYDDPEGDVHAREKFVLKGDDPRTFAVHVKDARRREVRYGLTVQTEDDIVELRDCATLAQAVFLGLQGEVVGGSYVQISLAPGAFGEGIDRMSVELRHADPMEKAATTRSIEFARKDPARVETWNYRFSRPGGAEVEYRISYYDGERLVSTSPVERTRSRRVEVPPPAGR